MSFPHFHTADSTHAHTQSPSITPIMAIRGFHLPRDPPGVSQHEDSPTLPARSPHWSCLSLNVPTSSLSQKHHHHLFLYVHLNDITTVGWGCIHYITSITCMYTHCRPMTSEPPSLSFQVPTVVQQLFLVQFHHVSPAKFQTSSTAPQGLCNRPCWWKRGQVPEGWV